MSSCELPSVNRNFIGFVGLLPGIVPNISTESFGSDAVVVNGTDSRNNNFLVDGANNNDDVIGQRAGTQARTPIEAIQEFQVLTHQFDAEFGRTTGAVINAITKQGTNRFRGSAFSFFQDAALTEKDFFAKQNNLAKPDTKQTQFGGTIGGPDRQGQGALLLQPRARADRPRHDRQHPRPARVQHRRDDRRIASGTPWSGSTSSSTPTTRGASAGCASRRRSRTSSSRCWAGRSRPTPRAKNRTSTRPPSAR